MGIHVNAILILTNNGGRIAVQYYVNYRDKITLSEDEAKQLESFKTVAGQREFESKLVSKITTKKSDNSKTAEDILIVNDFNVIYSNCDVIIAVVGTKNSNELILSSVLQSIKSVLEEICGSIAEANLYEKLDLVFLLLDHVVDRGDIKTLCERIGSSAPKYSEHLPINQAIYTARNNIIKTLLSTT